MIPIPTGVRVWLATGHTDMRCGFPSLALRVQESAQARRHGRRSFLLQGQRRRSFEGHGPAPRASRRRNRTDQAKALAFDVGDALFALLGKDITTIDGLGPYLSLKLIAEMRRRPLLVAKCKAFYLLAGTGAEQQGLRRQNALLPNTPIRRPGGGTSAPCCGDRGSYSPRARRLL